MRMVNMLHAKKRLPADIRDMLSNAANGIFVSVASVWEIAIKLAAVRRDARNPCREVA